MIGYIKGTIEGIFQDHVFVENNGIGYRIFTSGKAIEKMNGLHQQVMLITYLHVREDELTLFGFPSTEEMETFKLLIGVNGIGPKAALAILSVLSVRDLALAIVAGDTKAITKANGVGAKGANRVIMELKDKMQIEDLFVSGDTSSDTQQSDMRTDSGGDSIQDTVLALVSLGYSEFEALRAVKQVENAKDMESETLIKAALKKLF